MILNHVLKLWDFSFSAVVDGNTERSRENSVSAAANRHDLLQNHSGSMVQNSSRQNSTASSGYDTASKKHNLLEISL